MTLSLTKVDAYRNVDIQNTLKEHKYRAVRIARERISCPERTEDAGGMAGKILVAKGAGSSFRSADQVRRQGRYPLEEEIVFRTGSR